MEQIEKLRQVTLPFDSESFRTIRDSKMESSPEPQEPQTSLTEERSLTDEEVSNGLPLCILPISHLAYFEFISQ